MDRDREHRVREVGNLDPTDRRREPEAWRQQAPQRLPPPAPQWERPTQVQRPPVELPAQPQRSAMPDLAVQRPAPPAMPPQQMAPPHMPAPQPQAQAPQAPRVVPNFETGRMPQAPQAQPPQRERERRRDERNGRPAALGDQI